MGKSFVSCLGALAFLGCGVGSTSNGLPATQSQPVIRGDACALFSTQQTCNADTSDGCHWVAEASGGPCYILPDGGGPACGSQGGACVGPVSGGGDGGLACGPAGGSTGSAGPNPCTQWTSQTSCQADAKDRCYWFLGPLCPTYILPDGGTGGCSGKGSCVQAPEPGPCDAGVSAQAGCGCAVPANATTAGEYVCVEQIGGPAQTAGSTSIACDAISNCSNADPCSCITGQGRCYASPNVIGLCVCDNGMR